MKKKLLISLMISAMIYIITILIGLIQFNPLAEILFSGIKLTISTFILTFLLLLLIDYYKQQVTQKKENQEKQSTNETSQQSNPNVTKKYEEATKANKQDANDNAVSAEDKEAFEAMQPPVVEYDEE